MENEMETKVGKLYPERGKLKWVQATKNPSWHSSSQGQSRVYLCGQRDP